MNNCYPVSAICELLYPQSFRSLHGSKMKSLQSPEDFGVPPTSPPFCCDGGLAWLLRCPRPRTPKSSLTAGKATPSAPSQLSNSLNSPNVARLWYSYTMERSGVDVPG
jgi:hypothetical protein